MINDSKNQNYPLVVSVDAETEALKIQANALEQRISELANVKADIEKRIHEFNIRHNQELGELLLQILKLRKENARSTSEYEETIRDYEEYYRDYSETKDEHITSLTEEEKIELKQKYKKAVWLCHPDVIDQEYKEKANKVFAELSLAYSKNDLQRVSEILLDLQANPYFRQTIENANDKDFLKQQVDRLTRRLKAIEEEVQNLRSSDIFKHVSAIEDLDDYFIKQKEELKAQLEYLTKAIK